jgi:hypothetical protein
VYRLSEELAKTVISMIKSPEFEGIGTAAFLPKHLNSIGIIDPICCAGSVFHYAIEIPTPTLYQNVQFTPPGVNGYFLYRKEELKAVQEPWEINRVLVDPTATNPDEMIDVADTAIVLPNDVEKLTAQTIHTMEQLIKKEPLIIDCLDWGNKNGK